MYEVEVEISFPASHRVTVAGVCEDLHEHNWTVRALLCGERLDSDGLLVDFTAVKKLLAEIADKLKGRDLTEVSDLAGLNPSAENVACYFHRQLAAQLTQHLVLKVVRVQEAPGCWASYRP